MLRKAQRLARSRDIARVQRARARKNSYFSLRRTPNGREISRATVVVAKSVSKKAVERNTLKRQVRALLVPYLNTVQPPTDMLISVKPPARGASFSKLRAALKNILT